MKKTIKFSNQIFLHKLDSLKIAIMNSNQVAGVIAKHLSQRPFHLNVIEAACRGRFKETGHSLVLADMLKHPTIQSSFLETFLGIHYEYMTVTAEFDRVDVALKGEDIFVIVENKVNGAEEQENQVYRYVHEIGIEKYGYDISQIFVVYLNPENHTMPSEYSLCDKNKKNNVFDKIGKEHYTIQSYKHDITDWLRKISIGNEPHISSALDQYINFLENKFHTSSLDKDMNKEIKDLILKELQVEDKSPEEQIAALDNQRDKVNELLNVIDSLKVELTIELSHKMMRDWQTLIEQSGIKLSHDEHSFGIRLNNKVWLGVWDGYDSGEHRPYWGFQLDSFKIDSMPDLYADIEKILNNIGIQMSDIQTENNWIAWKYTKNGVEDFKFLYHSAENLGYTIINML